MKKVIVISPAAPKAVRTVKFANFLYSKGVSLEFWGWSRTKIPVECDTRQYKKVNYILYGGGNGTKILPLYYLLLIVKIIIKIVFTKNTKEKIFFATNFETAFAVYIASHLRRLSYVYDIWDEIAISHNFPSIVRRLLRRIDSRIRKRSKFYLHVDDNRVSEIDSDNYLIVYNSPYDYFKGVEREVKYDNSYAVTGYLNDGRGLSSILNFANANPDIKLIVIGEFINDEMKQRYLETPNVEYYHFMPQEQLFDIIKSCRGIFSLYDTHIPIYRLAASNKLYDAMMLTIPVIVNKEVLASKFVRKHNIGYVINYEFDSTWDCLVDDSFEQVRTLGQNGRKYYLKHVEFASMMEKVFWTQMKELL